MTSPLCGAPLPGLPATYGCALDAGHEGAHSAAPTWHPWVRFVPLPHETGGVCGAELTGLAVGGAVPPTFSCSLPPGHTGAHHDGSAEWLFTEHGALPTGILPHLHWTGEPCPACDEGEQLQAEAALDRLVEGGVLVEERDDAGRVRHVMEWRDPDPPSYERLQGLVHLAEEIIGSVRAMVEDGHPVDPDWFRIVSQAVQRWEEA